MQIGKEYLITNTTKSKKRILGWNFEMSQIFPSRITLALIPESGVTVCVQDIGMSDLTNVECLGSDSSFLYTRPECLVSQCHFLLLLF